MRHWLIADGDDGDQWDKFYRDGVVRITGRQRLGDLRKYASVRELVQASREKYRKEFKTKNPAIKVRLSFVNTATSFGRGKSEGVRYVQSLCGTLYL